MSAPLARRVGALSIARQCIELGARISTIEQLSGLPVREFRHLCFPTARSIPRGRPPNSVEWLHRRTSMLEQTAAAVLMTTYRRLQTGGFASTDSLLGAYAYYTSISDPPHRISLDRALDLASHLDGRWLAKVSSLDIVACGRCGSSHLAARGTPSQTTTDCPFCALVSRYTVDPRVQACFRVRPLPDGADLQICLLAMMRDHGAESDVERAKAA